MAQFGNRMFGGAVPGLLGGISDMMARYPALGGGMTRPAFNKLPPGMPGAIPIDLSQAQNLPAFQQGGPTNYPGVSTPAVMPPSFGGGPSNYPGIERPMPPMGGSVGAGKPPPGIGPIGGGMMAGGERPGAYAVLRNLPPQRMPANLARGLRK